MDLIPHISEKAKKDLAHVRAAQQGDEKAFNILLSKYRDTVYYMLLKMVHNEYDAQDLTIEAFGKAFHNIHRFSPDYAFSTWLFRIATNNCIDFLRRKHGGTYLSIENNNNENEPYIPIRSNSLNPEEELIKEQRAVFLKIIVSKLKPRYRQLVELRYFKERSYEEISKELNLPLGTVKAQLHRARKLLFDLLGVNPF